jgi:hypothetical protein
VRVELPPKPLSETSNYTVDFISRIGYTSYTASAVVTASLYSGTDPNPSAILAGAPVISGSQVTQSITGGVLGNIYELSYALTVTPFSPVTLPAQTLVITAYLAIIPDLP